MFLTVLMCSSLLASNNLCQENSTDEKKTCGHDRIRCLSERDLLVNTRDLLMDYERAYIVRYNVPKTEYESHELLTHSRALIPLLNIEVEKLIKEEHRKKFSTIIPQSAQDYIPNGVEYRQIFDIFDRIKNLIKTAESENISTEEIKKIHWHFVALMEEVEILWIYSQLKLENKSPSIEDLNKILKSATEINTKILNDYDNTLQNYDISQHLQPVITQIFHREECANTK